MSTPSSTPTPQPKGGESVCELAVQIALVAVGGALGALARVAASSAGGSDLAGPVATQLVNGAGAFALGLLLAILERRGPMPRWRAFLAVGVLGSFTTYAGWIAESRALAATTSAGVAPFFLVATLALGIAAFELGRRMGAALPPPESADGGRSAAGSDLAPEAALAWTRFAALGFCGSLSTFWTLCSDGSRLARAGWPSRAAVYWLLHLLAGPTALDLGARLAR